MTIFECCHQVPLFGSWHKAHVAIGGDALPVENHLHGGVLLVHKNRMVGVVVEKHAETLRVEIVLIGHPHGKIGAEQVWARGQGQEKAHVESREHRLRFGLLLLA